MVSSYTIICAAVCNCFFFECNSIRSSRCYRWIWETYSKSTRRRVVSRSSWTYFINISTRPVTHCIHAILLHSLESKYSLVFLCFWNTCQYSSSKVCISNTNNTFVTAKYQVFYETVDDDTDVSNTLSLICIGKCKSWIVCKSIC